MKKEIYSHYQDIWDRGPYSLEKFNKIINDTFEEVKKNFRENLQRFTIEIFNEYNGYDGDYGIRLTFYRFETDEEEKKREEREAKTLERMEKLKEANKKKAEKVKDKKKDPEYIKYLELKKKYKNL